jgi:hypothetical protein
MRWWLSFAKPEESLGVCVVEADTFMGAVIKTHRMGINPGGEVMGVPVEGVSDDQVNVLLKPDVARVVVKGVRAIE